MIDIIAKGKTQLEIDNENLLIKKEEIKLKLEQKLTEVLAKGFPYKEYHIQSDEKAKVNMSGAITSSTDIDFPPIWRTYENVSLPIESYAELQAISLQMRNFVNTEYMKIWNAKDNIQNSSSLEEINLAHNEYISSAGS